MNSEQSLIILTHICLSNSWLCCDSYILSALTTPALIKRDNCISATNKYYSPACQHEQKNKKTTGQIKFLVVKTKQRIKLVLQHSLCK